ncbi:MAG: hypothetical protein V4502_02915 [Pseudomonadota bacterium]
MINIRTPIALALLSACGRPQQQQTTANDPAPPLVNEVVSTSPINETGNLAASREPPLAEPKGPIDPKSVEAAGQVVQLYGGLIEQNRFADAAKLWGDSKAASEFARTLKPDVHLEIGNLGETDGAAGSIYTTVPVVFYGDGYRRAAEIVLRRVNDVPGSTAAQRRWHIERIDWKAAN